MALYDHCSQGMETRLFWQFCPLSQSPPGIHPLPGLSQCWWVHVILPLFGEREHLSLGLQQPLHFSPSFCSCLPHCQLSSQHLKYKSDRSVCKLRAGCPGTCQAGLPFSFSFSTFYPGIKLSSAPPLPWLFPELSVMSTFFIDIPLNIYTIHSVCYKRGREKRMDIWLSTEKQTQFHLTSSPNTSVRYIHVILLLEFVPDKII